MAKNNNKKPGKSGGTNKGMFNFQQIMDDFYSYKPEAGDTAGQMMKQAYQGNLVQSAVDTELSKSQAQFNSGIAQANMTHQADLEQRNQSALMKEQFNYAMQNMDAQFQYQNKAANAQHDRDLGMLAATGQQQRKNVQAQGQQDRLGEIVRGEQDRMKQEMVNQSAEKINKYTSDSEYKKATDVASTQADADKFTATTQKEAATEVATTQAEADKFKATAAADASKYGADKTVDVAKVNAQGTIDNTKETGAQTRETMETENRLKAKDRANMHSYARSTARAM